MKKQAEAELFEVVDFVLNDRSPLNVPWTQKERALIQEKARAAGANTRRPESISDVILDAEIAQVAYLQETKSGRARWRRHDPVAYTRFAAASARRRAWVRRVKRMERDGFHFAGVWSPL